MKYRLFIFLFILFLFFLYTGAKVTPFFPNRKFLAWSLTFLFFAVMIGWEFAYHSHAFSSDSKGFIALAWVGSIFMGLWATFFVFSLPFDLIYLVISLLRKIGSLGAAIPDLRVVFTRWIPAVLAAISILISILGLREALASPIVKEISIPIANLPNQFEELKIIQISDPHVSPTLRRGYIVRVVEKVMELKPDIIFFTGDIADGSPDQLAFDVEPFSKLKAPLGAYYITGNHEYYWDAESWVKKARELGFEVLLNENRVINFKGSSLLIGGVTDTAAGHFIPSHKSDPGKAAETNLKPDLKILLAHRPESCFEAEKAGFDVQLCGHAHSGQFFPFNLLMPFFSIYYRDLNRHGHMWVYVSVGTGYWGPPNRFLIPAEITSIQLKRDSSSEGDPS